MKGRSRGGRSQKGKLAERAEMRGYRGEEVDFTEIFWQKG